MYFYNISIWCHKFLWFSLKIWSNIKNFGSPKMLECLIFQNRGSMLLYICSYVSFYFIFNKCWTMLNLWAKWAGSSSSNEPSQNSFLISLPSKQKENQLVNHNELSWASSLRMHEDEDAVDRKRVAGHYYLISWSLAHFFPGQHLILLRCCRDDVAFMVACIAAAMCSAPSCIPPSWFQGFCCLSSGPARLFFLTSFLVV